MNVCQVTPARPNVFLSLLQTGWPLLPSFSESPKRGEQKPFFHGLCSEIYVNIASSSDLGIQQNEYILESRQYLARCDSCRKAVSLGEDWYHKQAEGVRLSSRRNAVTPLDCQISAIFLGVHWFGSYAVMNELAILACFSCRICTSKIPRKS
jgi:hypothetical protein